MYRIGCAVVLTLAFTDVCYGLFIDASHYRQQGARVLYTDPKYCKDMSVFTSRPDRKSRYFTTANGTCFITLGNNVSVSILLYNMKTKLLLINLEMRLCDFFKQPWARDFIQKYTDFPGCPVPPGTYHINGVELPPKNFPFPYEKIDYRLNFKSISTKSKANIFEIYMEFKYIGPKRK